jgi:hypothetical protein
MFSTLQNSKISMAQCTEASARERISPPLPFSSTDGCTISLTATSTIWTCPLDHLAFMCQNLASPSLRVKVDPEMLQSSVAQSEISHKQEQVFQTMQCESLKATIYKCTAIASIACYKISKAIIKIQARWVVSDGDTNGRRDDGAS